MSYVQKDNSGSLFPNDKGDNANRPDLKGSIMVDGVEYWISAWKKEGNGKKFLSLSVQPKEESGNRQPVGAGASNQSAVDPDDIFP